MTERCPKCGRIDGSDWKQCRGSCPMEGSPHYSAAWRRDSVCEVAKWIDKQADEADAIGAIGLAATYRFLAEAIRTKFAAGEPLWEQDRLPSNHRVIEQSEMLDGRVSQTVQTDDGKEYQRIVSADEAIPPELAAAVANTMRLRIGIDHADPAGSRSVVTIVRTGEDGAVTFEPTDLPDFRNGWDY